MIEINLLPAEYRPRDKTNLPLMLTVAVGMLVVGGIIMYGITLNNDLAGLDRDHADKEKKMEGLNEQVKHVKDLETQIDNQKKRQSTIIAISQSKIMWSLKLEQLSNVMKQYPEFWIIALRLKKVGKTKGKGGQPQMGLKLECAAKGGDLEEVAKFRESIKADPNFFYHFEGLASPYSRVTTLGPGFNDSHRIDFSLTLPLKVPEEDEGKKGKGKKGKKKK